MKNDETRMTKQMQLAGHLFRHWVIQISSLIRGFGFRHLSFGLFRLSPLER
jgi:hypothetical protein